MKTFYLSIDIDLNVTVPIQAESVEQAIEMAESGDYELPNFSDYFDDVYESETRLVNLCDENTKVVKDFYDEED